jgi:hypothetical protein
VDAVYAWDKQDFDLYVFGGADHHNYKDDFFPEMT